MDPKHKLKNRLCLAAETLSEEAWSNLFNSLIALVHVCTLSSPSTRGDISGRQQDSPPGQWNTAMVDNH